MALKKYRRQIIRVRDANDELPEIILSTGDEAGRIIQLQITNGENYSTQCRFWLQKEEGVNVFQDMEQVTAPYPTWEAAINTGGLEPGVYQAMFRVGDNDGSVTETFRTTARVLQGMLVEGEETEEMQSQLNEFEQRTEDALAANAQATQAATTAAEAATAATDAIEHALDSVDVRILDTGVLSVTNVDGVPTSYDVKQQVSNAINPKIEDAEAATQRANTAADDANTAADAANQAAGSVDASIDAAETALNNMGASITGGVITVTNKDGSPTEYDVKGYVDSELAQPLADAASATEAANRAANQATAAKNAANTAASEATDAKTAAEAATTEAQAATTAATNAATAANNAAEAANDAVDELIHNRQVITYPQMNAAVTYGFSL